MSFGQYGWMLIAATIASLGGALFMAGRLGVDRRRAAVCLASATVGVFVGARLLYWIAQPASAPGDESASLLWLGAGRFSLHGGVIGGAVAGGLAAHMLRIDVWRLADACAVPTAIGVAILRMGCHARGCCHGLPTSVPWTVTPDVGSPAFLSQVAANPATILTGVHPIHPTQLYELAAALVAACVALWLLHRRSSPGVAAIASAMTFTALRWIILPLRDLGPTRDTDLLLYPTLYAVLLIALPLLLWRRSRLERR